MSLDNDFCHTPDQLNTTVVFPPSESDSLSATGFVSRLGAASSQLLSIPIGKDRIPLKSQDEISERLENRLRKYWSRTLGLTDKGIQILLQESEFQNLTPYFDFDRTIRTLGGTLRVTFDPQNRFDSKVLTSPDLSEQTNLVAGSILSTKILEGLSREHIVDALVLDQDRLPKNLANMSSERKRRETVRAIRDEVLPTLVSGILGELGVPQGRGSRGFDLSCQAHSLTHNVAVTDDVQVKRMRIDSPIFNKESLNGRKQFWKLAAILCGQTSLTVSNKALLIQDSATDAQVLDLVNDLVAVGALPNQIIVLDKEQLKLSGINLLEIKPNDGEDSHPKVAIQVDLQKFLRFSWARQLSLLAVNDFRPVEPITILKYTNEPEGLLTTSCEALAEPIEISLLRANGCLDIVEYCKRQKIIANGI